MDIRYDQRYGKACQKVVSDIAKMLKNPDKQVEVSNEDDDMPESFLKIPDTIGKVSEDVKYYDKTKVLMEKEEIKAILNDQIGTVERVLSDHIAILSFKKSSKIYRVF